ncbi:MAG: sugar phosphate isomerase/epimerase [candidate division Zixibacteria bacterium]|nr:sugar phosphate isomerase/epimerase [candidate division Zixibacteria bacterium]
MRYSFMIVEPLVGLEGGVEGTFAFIGSCGYQGVELNLTPEVLSRLDEIEEASARHGLPVVSMLTGAAYQEGLCLSSPDAEVRARTVERLSGYVEIGRRFGCILVVGLLQGLRSDEPDAHTANGRIVEGLLRVGRVAETAGVEIVVEPVNHLQVGFNNSVTEVRALIDAIGSSAVFPMVDTIHMNIEDRSLVQPIYDCGPALRHVHLCESHGGLPGTGHLDFHSVLLALDNIGYAHFASIKVYRKAGLREAAQKSMAYFGEVGS